MGPVAEQVRYASSGRQMLLNTRTPYWVPMRRLRRLKSRPRCSIAQFLDILLADRSQHNGSFVGRQLGECEVHVDGVLLYRAFGALAAGLAYLTYQAIKGNPLFQLKRRKRQAVSFQDQIELIILGRFPCRRNDNDDCVFEEPSYQTEFFANLYKASAINFTVTWEDFLYMCY